MTGGGLDFNSKLVETPWSSSVAKVLASTFPEAENLTRIRNKVPFSQTRGMEEGVGADRA